MQFIMECEVICTVNGEVAVLKAKKELQNNDTVWSVYNQSEIVAKLVRFRDFKGLQVWGSRIPTDLTEEQIYWIGVQLNAA